MRPVIGDGLAREDLEQLGTQLLEVGCADHVGHPATEDFLAPAVPGHRRPNDARAVERRDQPVENEAIIRLQRKVCVAGDGDLAAFQPGSGIAMSYDDLKVVECHALARSIATGVPQGATIHDAVRAAELVDAMVTSYEERRWVTT